MNLFLRAHEFEAAKCLRQALPLEVGEDVRLGLRKDKWVDGRVYLVRDDGSLDVQVAIKSDPNHTTMYRKVKRKRIKRHDIHLTSDHAWTEAFVADTEYPAHEVQQFPRAARPLSLSLSLRKRAWVFYRCGCSCFD